VPEKYKQHKMSPLKL